MVLLIAINIYLFLALLVSSYVMFYIFINGRAWYMKLVAIIALGIFTYIFGYMMEINSPELNAAVFWNQFQYLTLPFLNGLWLLLCLYYTGFFKEYRQHYLLIVLIVPAITFLLRLTNRWHHWYYTGFQMRRFQEINILVLGKGPWYIVQTWFSIALAVATVITLLWALIQARGRSKTKFTLMLIATMLPVLSMLLISFDFHHTGLDFNVFVLPIVMALFTAAVRIYDFLEVSPLAREHIFNSSEMGMLVVSNDNRLVDFNEVATEIFLRFGVPLERMYLEDIRGENETLYRWLTSGDGRSFHFPFEDRDEFWTSTSAPVVSRSNGVIGRVFTLQDVTLSVEYQQKLEVMAKTDHLSKLFNRRELVSSGERLLERAAKEGREIAFMMIDIDHFKNINDSFGHQCGDEVIVKMGDLIRNAVREGDISSRSGGEEFAVIFSGANKETTLGRAENLRESIEKSTMIRSRSDYRVTASIGLAIHRPGMSLGDLMNAADKKLYEAKHSGRNLVCS